MIQERSQSVTIMKSCGIIPIKQVLENEASAAYKASIYDPNRTYQLVPPNEHCRNIAKKSIQAWKYHFVALLRGTADNFPLHLWCQLMPHMEFQLNLLTQYHVLTHIST